MLRSTHLAIALGLLAGACTDDGPASFGDSLTDPQLPPRGTSDVQTWIAAAHYQSWHCEAQPHAARPPSPHGRNRICNNDALHATTSTAFPSGAASVKEIFDGDALTTYAVARKVADGDDGDSWYWYEGNRNKVFANSEGAANCTDCHSHAQRDYVFTVVP